MNAGAKVPSQPVVSAAEIARMAGVTRAAVSNWRRRYPDFPAPANGGRNALFLESEVREWLRRQKKGGEVSGEVLVWQELRRQYQDDILRGISDLAEFFLAGVPGSLAPATRHLARGVVGESSAVELVEGLVERVNGSPSRAGTEHISTSRLIRAVRQFAGPAASSVFDPACGVGSLLLAFASGTVTLTAGQEVDESAARLAQARAKLAGQPEAAIRQGDSLREDRWAELKADLVVCDPPSSGADWGREELLLDSRWEFGVPTRGESELAWLQHCFVHTAPGGQVVVVMPVSAAYRRAGRRIRAELVRRGALVQVVALPAGMDSRHTQPVHLWLLRRPMSAGGGVSSVRMVDVASADPDQPIVAVPALTVEVPLIELLDEDVDLSPGRYVVPRRTDHLDEYLSVRDSLSVLLSELSGLLPSLSDGTGSLDGATVKVAELARAGLVDFVEGEAVSTSQQLDNDYLRGFLRSTANTMRSTSATGTFRADARAARLPQMGVDEQRRYGEVFRALDEFERRLQEFTRLGERVISVARDGLTAGALRPSAAGADSGLDSCRREVPRRSTAETSPSLG